MITSPITFLYFYTTLSMSFYILMILLHHAKRYKYCLGLSLIIFFSILTSLRGLSIGSDSSFYFQLVTNPIDFTQQIEPIMYLIASFTRLLGGKSFVFFLIISLIINITLYVAFFKIDGKNYLIYTAFLSVSFLYLNANINIVRQGIAISFVFLSIYYLVNFKTYKYLFFSFIAIFVHSSALVTLLMPLFLFFNTRKRVTYFVILIMILSLSGLTVTYLISLVKDVHWTLDRLYWYMTWGKLTPFKLKHVYFLYIVILLAYILRYQSLDILQKRYFSIFLSLFFIMYVFKVDDFLVDRFSFYYIPLAVFLYFNLIKIYRFKNYQFVLALFTLLPFLWIFKTAYQYNLWWILGEIR